MADKIIVRRCLWCRARSGRERYFLSGEWTSIFSPYHFFGDVNFTDGLCPECFAVETKKLTQTK